MIKKVLARFSNSIEFKNYIVVIFNDDANRVFEYLIRASSPCKAVEFAYDAMPNSLWGQEQLAIVTCESGLTFKFTVN